MVGLRKSLPRRVARAWPHGARQRQGFELRVGFQAPGSRLGVHPAHKVVQRCAQLSDAVRPNN